MVRQHSPSARHCFCKARLLKKFIVPLLLFCFCSGAWVQLMWEGMGTRDSSWSPLSTFLLSESQPVELVESRPAAQQLAPEDAGTAQNKTSTSTVGNTNGPPSRKNSRDEPRLELFMERLDRLLPEKGLDDETGRLVTPADVQKIENDILTFNIPRKVIIDIPQGEYVGIQGWSWLYENEGDNGRCPNCILRHSTLRDKPDGTMADVRMNNGCPGSLSKGYRATKDQVVISNCGESPAGSGRAYLQGRKEFDYDASFLDATLMDTLAKPDGPQRKIKTSTGQQPFQRTYAHMHLIPPAPQHGFHRVHNITEMVLQLLRPPPPRNTPQGKEFLATFVHNNCSGRRGSLIRSLLKLTNLTIACYSKCMHNLPNDLDFGNCITVRKHDPARLFFGDCEATRDGSKTIYSSRHPFTFALENTLSPDYITEKRYQPLFGGSVPIVWNNDNSLDYLPSVDSAILVDPVEDAVSLAHRILRVASDPELYGDLFAWKKRGGLRPGFVRKLFLSSDFMACRICEYVAHHHDPPIMYRNMTSFAA